MGLWNKIKNFFTGGNKKEKKKIDTGNLNKAVKDIGKVATNVSRTANRAARKVSNTPTRDYQRIANKSVNETIGAFRKTSNVIKKGAIKNRMEEKHFQKALEQQRRSKTLSDFQTYGLNRKQLREIDKNHEDIGKVLKSTAKRTVGGYGSALGRTTSSMKTSNAAINAAAWNEASNRVKNFKTMSYNEQQRILNPLRDKYRKQFKANDQKSHNEKLLKKTDKLIESGAKDLEDVKKGKSKAGKFGIDLASGMLDFGADVGMGMLTGGSSLAPMFVRATGQSAYEAEKEGAKRKDALKYGVASGGIEVATEKLASIAKPLEKTMGKGFADELVGRTINKLASKPKSELGQKVAYHGSKTLASALGEGLEEMISEGLNPAIANKIYADAIGKHKDFNIKDVAYAGALGGAMGGLLGGGGQIVENHQINNADYDAEKIIKRAKQQSEDSRAYKTALVAEEKLKRGEKPTNMQWEIMRQDVNRDIEAQENAFDDVINSAQKVMKKNGFVEPLDYVEGNVVLANNTERKHSEIANNIFKETKNEKLAKAVADIETGIATMDTTDLFLPEEKENRAVFESIAGEMLPATNVETRQYLLDRIGKNLLKSAEEETMYRNDVLQGEQLAEVNNMGPIGQSAFISGYEKADNKDEYRSLFNHYYKGGRNNLGFETVANMNPVGNENVAIDDRYQMYNAGFNDSINGEQSMANRIAVATNKAKASDIKLMSKVANRLGINIEITDNEGMQNKLGGDRQFSIEEAPNGFYDNGKIVINIEADKPLSAIFSHELTHELKDKNTEAYKQFRDFVVEAWKNRDAESFAEEINNKIEHYKANGIELTEEEAIEEILADSTWELVQNEDIINELCKQNRSLAQSILDAIEKVIEKLKAVLTGNALYEPRIEKKLYEELGIAEEVAKMWVDGIANMNTISAINHRREPLKFSIKEDFATQIDKVLNDNGAFEQTHLYMGETPKVLTDLGLRKLPMLITAKHIYTMAKDSGKYKKVNYHDLGAELIKQLPKAIAEPIGIIESATKDDSIVVLTELIDKKSRPVIVAIKVNGYGNYNDVEIESNVVTSGYGKDNITSFIKKNFGKNRILYWNNKKARTINTPELQLLNNIDNSSFADTVSRFKEKVNEISNKENKKFSLKEPVEVGDKLIAMHNITQDKLWKALKLGGFPMPSLAVTKAKIGHTNFGDISLLFDKSTINPEADSRNSKDKLKTIDSDNYEQQYNDLSDELANIISKIASKTSGSSNDFIKQDSIGMNIADAILEGNTTAESLKNYLNKYGSKVTPEDMIPLENLIKEVANMPVNMFEAKPERSVRFDEVVGAVVPADIDTDLISTLEEEGIEVSKYESDEDRIDTVNRLADEKNIMFSIKENGNNLTAKQYFKFGWATANGVLNTKEAVDFFNKLKYAESKKYPKSKDGDYIIEVGEKDGINNKLVYTNGDWNDPSIYKVVTINALEDETILDDIRRSIYYYEEYGGEVQREVVESIYRQEVVSETFRSDWQSYEEFRAGRERRSGEGDSREDRGLNGRGRNTGSDKKYSLKTSKQDELLKKLRNKLAKNETRLKKDLSPEEESEILHKNAILIMQIQRLEYIQELEKIDGKSRKEEIRIRTEISELEDILKSMDVKPLEFEVVEVPVITDELIEEYNQRDDLYFGEIPALTASDVKTKQVRSKSVDELEAQIENLKKENERLVQEKKLTYGKLPDVKEIKKKVNQHVRALMGGQRTSLVLVDKATNRVVHIRELIQKGDHKKAALEAYHAAAEVLEEVDFTPLAPGYDDYLSLCTYFRTTPIGVSEKERNNIVDFKDVRKKMFGKIRFVNLENNPSCPVDSVAMELEELFPGFFGEKQLEELGIAANEDLIEYIVDLRRKFDAFDYVLNDEDFTQLAKEFGNDLINIAMETKPRKTVADKIKEHYDDKIEKLKADFEEATKDVNAKLEKKFGDSYKNKIEKEIGKDIRKEERIRANAKKDAEIQKLKDGYKEKENKRKDTAEHKKLVTEIEKNLKWLSDRLTRPTDDKHIPEEFRKLVAEFLYGIDRQTARSKKLQENSGRISLKTLNLQKLQEAYESIAKEDGSGEFEYDEYIAELIVHSKKKLDGKSVDAVDNTTLKEFKTIVDAIVHQVKMVGKNFNENLEATREEIAKEIVKDFDSEIKRQSNRKKKKKKGDYNYKDYTGLRGTMDKLLNEDMVTTGDFFELLGNGMYKLYRPLREGFDKHVNNRQATREMFAKTFEKYFDKKKPGSKLEKLRSAESTIDIDLANGHHITMTPAQIMSLYCLNKREQARGHIYGAGIVSSTITSDKRLKKIIGAVKQVQAETMQVTPKDVENIIKHLTDEQKAIADDLMEFLNTTCADWGNEASMKLFGYKKFTEKNYFPIKSSDVYLNDNLETRQIDEVIKNFGFTKGTVVKANNPIVVADIFEVVADHINKMSLYNSFAVPIADFQRVYNYKIKNEDGLRTHSVRSKMKKAFGEKPEKYIKNFMVDLNNNNATKSRDTGLTRIYNKALANYKKAAIGFNLRVLVQQPTAILRAMQYISPKNFFGVSNPKKNLKEMRKHCPIAMWKHWGYSETDVSRDVEDIMMNNEWSKLDLITMRPYGFADDLTWSMIWSAVKREVKAKHKNIKVGSDEFWKLCNERASYVYDKTQVVDSPFHKSQIMRDKGIMQKTVSSFMAEPTRTFNLVRTEMMLAIREYQNGDKAKATKRMSRTITVFVANAALVSAVAAVIDALRGKTPDKDDKDKDKTKKELWWENFITNLDDNANPLNMIVGVKDIWQLKDGWGTSNMALEGVEALWKNIDEWNKYMSGESKKSQEELIKGSAEALGQLFGVPFKNVFRELKTFFPGVFAAGSKSADDAVRAYEAKEKSFVDKIIERFGGKGKSEKEREQEAYDDRIKNVKKALDGLNGKEAEEKAWETVTKGYTGVAERGDFKTLKKMKQTFVDLGYDKLAKKFDEKIESKAKTGFKKSIGYIEIGEHNPFKEYLIKECGYKKAQFTDLYLKSDTAKEFGEAVLNGNDEEAVQACVDLIIAGASDEDLDLLWERRTRNIDAKDYAEGTYSTPVSGTVTSDFGYRTPPTAGASSYHQGIDIAAKSGSNVIAADGGKVSSVGYNRSAGNYIRILHGNGRYTVYKHLNDGVVLKGDVIKKGQIIGHVGSTGNSTGPHLHFEIIQDGRYLNPKEYL